MSARARVVLFGVVLVVVIGVAVAAIVSAAGDQSDKTSSVSSGASGSSSANAPPKGPRMLYRVTARSDAYGRLGVAPLADPDTPSPYVSDLECQVADLAGDVGVCLTSDFSVLRPYSALITDGAFHVRHKITLEGAPSRTRLSPGGTMAGMTVFVSGHSYAEAGFSTVTTFVRTSSGEVLGNLEDFAVTKDGSPFKSADFNFWGVTWVDEDTFYATLGTGGTTYLVRGDVSSRAVTVVKNNVECPSLSPDGTRIAYKKRTDSGPQVHWQITVLDLATGVETPIAEKRSIDDQVEWLDDATVLYTAVDDDPVVTSVWSAPADGSGTPTLFRDGAAAPALAR